MMYTTTSNNNHTYVVAVVVLHYENNIKLTPSESPVDLSLSRLTIGFVSCKNTTNGNIKKKNLLWFFS